MNAANFVTVIGADDNVSYFVFYDSPLPRSARKINRVVRDLNFPAHQNIISER
jgi:hypothetical protein